MAPCETLLLSNVGKEPPTMACNYQTNGFALSRPRDFISALNKERESGAGSRSAEISQTFSSGNVEAYKQNRSFSVNTEDKEKRDR